MLIFSTTSSAPEVADSMHLNRSMARTAPPTPTPTSPSAGPGRGLDTVVFQRPPVQHIILHDAVTAALTARPHDAGCRMQPLPQTPPPPLCSPLFHLFLPFHRTACVPSPSRAFLRVE